MVKEIEEIDLDFYLNTDYTKWAWINIKNGIPESPGVYMMSILYGSSKRKKIMYIGMSANLKQRLSSHPHHLTLKALGFETKVHYMTFFNRVTTNKRWNEGYQYNNGICKVEKYLIESLQPPLNYRDNCVQFSIEKMIRDEMFNV